MNHVCLDMDSPQHDIVFAHNGKFMKDEFIEYVPILEIHNAGDRVFLKSILDVKGITSFILGEYVAPYVFNSYR